MFFINILANYIIPIIYDSLVSLVLVLSVLFVFRFKDPNIRIMFFFLPLIRPFIIIAEKVDFNLLYFNYNKTSLGFRVPDPKNIINIPFQDNYARLLAANMDYLIMTIIAAALFVFLLARWINLALFYRNLAYEEKVTKNDVPDIFKIISDFCLRTKIAAPDVSLTHKVYISPFVVGVRKATLVLSPRLIENINNDKKEVLIRHELCHLKRKDNLTGWIAIILKDLSFFNPFAYIAYYLIRAEQEKICDQLIIKYSNYTPLEVAQNILNSIKKLKLTIGPSSRLLPAFTSSFFVSRFISRKRLENRINVLVNTDVNKIYSRVLPKILMYLMFIFLLVFQIVYTFKIGNVVFALR
jgi:beta-lactamase regulating signal transducer with metallopeptidase domain